MKRFLLSLFAASLVLGGQADGAHSTAYIGANYTRSYIKPDGLSSFEGNLGGMQAMVQYRPPCGPYAGIGASWRYGSNHGSDGTRDLLDVDVHERLGWTAQPNCVAGSLTLYSGFGFRHLSHRLHPKTGDSIKLRYNEFYVPVGLLAQYETACCFSVGVDAVWMPQVYPTVTISGIAHARWVTENTYGNFKVGIPLTLCIPSFRCLRVVVKPFYEFWEDGQTKAKTEFGEPLGLPGNTYRFWGADLNLQVEF